MSPKTWKWLCIFVLWVQLSWEKYSCFILWHKMREKNTVNYNSKPFVFTCWATAQGYVLVTTLILEVCCLRKPRGASGDIFFLVIHFLSQIWIDFLLCLWLESWWTHFISIFSRRMFFHVWKKKFWKWWRKNVLFSNNLV